VLFRLLLDYTGGVTVSTGLTEQPSNHVTHVSLNVRGYGPARCQRIWIAINSCAYLGTGKYLCDNANELTACAFLPCSRQTALHSAGL